MEGVFFPKWWLCVTSIYLFQCNCLHCFCLHPYMSVWYLWHHEKKGLPCYTHHPLSPDSYGHIEPDMVPFWHLGKLAASFVMLNQSNENTLYNTAQVSKIKQLVRRLCYNCEILHVLYSTWFTWYRISAIFNRVAKLWIQQVSCFFVILAFLLFLHVKHSRRAKMTS